MKGDAWHAAAELHKLELILNILTFGYSVLYLEPDVTVFRNPMPHLLSLQVCCPAHTPSSKKFPHTSKCRKHAHVNKQAWKGVPYQGKLQKSLLKPL